MKSRIQQIGLIGVGLLGSALAERLCRHGVALYAFDVRPGQLSDLQTAGGVACGSAREVFAACDTVLLCLPTSEIVGELLNQHVAEMTHGLTIVDTTTGNPEQIVATAHSLRRRGVDYVEANVAGSSAQVRAGQATLLVGGETSPVERTRPLLESIADRHFYLGPVGSASRFKLVHNLILGLHRAVLAEGLTFAKSLGFDPATTLEILRQTPATSAVMEQKGQKMIDADYQPQARLSQHLKDVLLILAEADRVGAKTPLSELHRTLLERAEKLGFGDGDNSAVIEVFRSRKTDSDG